MIGDKTPSVEERSKLFPNKLLMLQLQSTEKLPSNELTELVTITLEAHAEDSRRVRNAELVKVKVKVRVRLGLAKKIGKMEFLMTRLVRVILFRE